MLTAITLSFLSGITRTIGRMLNAQLSERIGLFQSTFYNYVLGFICSVLALLLNRKPVPVAALASGQIPIWAYFGGAVGVLFVVLSNFTAPKMPAFTMTMWIFVGQISAGVVLDGLIHQQLSLAKLVGGSLVLAGLLWNLSAGKNKYEST